MLSEIIHIMEYTLYIYLSVSVGYIVLFSAASHFFKQKKYPATTVRQRFIILVPAYKEDAVIHACVTSVLRQTYPADIHSGVGEELQAELVVTQIVTSPQIAVACLIV